MAAVTGKRDSGRPVTASSKADAYMEGWRSGVGVAAGRLMGPKDLSKVPGGAQLLRPTRPEIVFPVNTGVNEGSAVVSGRGLCSRSIRRFGTGGGLSGLVSDRCRRTGEDGEDM